MGTIPISTRSGDGDSLYCFIWSKLYTLPFDAGAECHLVGTKAGLMARCSACCRPAKRCDAGRTVCARRHARHTFDESTENAARLAVAILSLLRWREGIKLSLNVFPSPEGDVF